jgi:hypothetical protein
MSGKEKPPPESWTLYPAVLPAIGYNPALGFLIGAAGTFGMYLGSPSTTMMSSASALALVTTQKQLVLQLSTPVLNADNDWQLHGYWRWLLYNKDTFGLGTGIPPVQFGFSTHPGGTPPPFRASSRWTSTSSDLALPSVGWDAKGTTGRGYVQGRFRGTAWVHAEAKWRFRITDNGLLGGALFANAETMSRSSRTSSGGAAAAAGLLRDRLQLGGA